MEAQDPLLSLLQAQGVTDLIDSDGGFIIDREVLKDHYSSLLENDLEAVLFVLQCAQRWRALNLEVETSDTHLQVNIELPKDSLLKDRLSPEPRRRLEALFPDDHPLYEIAQGFNILSFSELTQSLDLAFQGDTLCLRWEFREKDLSTRLKTLLSRDDVVRLITV